MGLSCSHDASLSLPSVKSAIPRATAIVSSFEKIALNDLRRSVDRSGILLVALHDYARFATVGRRMIDLPPERLEVVHG
jgi:hypothetical protein